jgi:hypothetical protein
MRRRFFRPAALGLLAVLLLVTGCENTIEPFSERATYSIYGFLSLDRSRQFIRVRSLQDPLDGDTGPLDVTVTLTNLDDGTSDVLKDSIVVFRDANTRVVTHNFWTDLPIRPETEYRLTVEDPNGGTTTASTTTPARLNTTLIPEEGNCRTDFFVEFSGIEDVRRIVDVDLEFRSEERNLRYSIDKSEIQPPQGSHSGAFFSFTPENLLGQTFGFNADDPDTPCTFETHCSKLMSKEVQVRYTFVGEDWFGRLRSDSLVTNPLNAPRITNGSGFFGSIGRTQTIVRTDTTAIPNNSPPCGDL